MATTLSDAQAAADALATARAALFDASCKAKIYTSGDSLLGTITFDATPVTSVVANVITLDHANITGSFSADGTMSYYKLFQADDTLLSKGDISTVAAATGSMRFTSLTAANGAAITMSGWTITQPVGAS